MPEDPPISQASVAEVWKLLDLNVAPLGDERVPLVSACDRILRSDVMADADQPLFDRSMVDGYAFIPCAAPAKLRVVGSVKAGEVAATALGPGEALRIFTGAAVMGPELGVIMQEEVRAEGEFIFVERPLLPGENVCIRGSYARKGEVLLNAGLRLGPVELAVLASVGEVRPSVNGLPRVAHATTGDEIVPPESTPAPGQIRNSNQILISTLLQASWVPQENIHQEHWGDDPARAAARLAAEPFATADIVLISGGASVGEHDYAARLLEGAGFTLRVRKINCRPGRPLLVGFRGRQMAFGLPGNPVSHFVCYHLFVRHALRRLMNRKGVGWIQRTLTAPIANAANRRPTYWPAKSFLSKEHNLAGQFLQPLPWHNSGHLAALVGANTLIFVPPDTPELPMGAKVDTLFVGKLFAFPLFKK